MKSISVKIIGLTLLAILISVVAIGGIGILSILRNSEADADSELRLICDNRRKSIDSYLNSVEQSVDTVANFAGDLLDTVELVEGGVAGLPADQLEFPGRDWNSPQQQKLDEYLRSYLAEIEVGLNNVANHTNGSVAYYFRLTPAVSSSATGFLYTKVDRPAFTKIELTDISLYKPDDLEHVGWYYIPIQNGRPTWVGPYQNMNLSAQMLSYVVPLYRAGVVVGLIGMDISAVTLVEQIENLEVYETGYAFLVDQDANIVYHPTLPAGGRVGDYVVRLAENVQASRGVHSEDVSLIEYDFEGRKMLAAYTALSNGLQLVITVPWKEISATSRGFANTVLITGLLIALIFSCASIVMLQRIIRPLENLTAVARQLIKGDYDVTLEAGGEDEVGILTNSFQHLVDHLKVYISDLNSKAYSDSLTRVKNKAGFDIFTRKLNDQIIAAGTGVFPTFAIVMLDCNDLKVINDTYGHAKGDVYLQNACTAVCKTFKHSPVFRIGGDEFTAILQRDDFERRDELVEELKEYERAHNAESTAPWDCVSLSVGVAVYDPEEDENVEDVLKRADLLMYEEKRRYKLSKNS